MGVAMSVSVDLRRRTTVARDLVSFGCGRVLLCDAGCLHDKFGYDGGRGKCRCSDRSGATRRSGHGLAIFAEQNDDFLLYEYDVVFDVFGDGGVGGSRWSRGGGAGFRVYGLGR